VNQTPPSAAASIRDARPWPVRWSFYQIGVFALCFLIILLDGFDTQAIAFAAPLLKQQIAADSRLLGQIFGAGLFGGFVGGLVFGPVADRIGRRPPLLLALCLIAVGSCLTGMAGTAQQIAVLRFVTGLGLGGAIPTVIAIVAEYSPLARRSTVVAGVFSGFPLGAVLGSVLSAYVLPHFGWQVLFIIGGVAPVLPLVLATLFLSESLHVLARAGRSEQFNALIRRLGDSADSLLSDQESHRAVKKHGPMDAGTLAVLFSKRLALSTVLIWCVCFLSLLCVYCILNWLPTLVAGAGLPLQTALLAAGAINVGSILGNVGVSRLNDRRSSCIPTGVAYCIGALFIGLIGAASSSSALMLGVCFAAGIFSVGAQMSITAIVARLYPAAARGTAVGWSFSVGRLGGLVGPVLAGFLLSFGMGFQTLMILMGALSLVSGIGIFALSMTAGLNAHSAESPSVARSPGETA